MQARPNFFVKIYSPDLINLTSSKYIHVPQGKIEPSCCLMHEMQSTSDVLLPMKAVTSCHGAYIRILYSQIYLLNWISPAYVRFRTQRDSSVNLSLVRFDGSSQWQFNLDNPRILWNFHTFGICQFLKGKSAK